MPRLHLIRHGETEWNRDGRIQGTATRRSPRRAASTRGRSPSGFDAEPIGKLWSSDLRRALETAEPLASRLGPPAPGPTRCRASWT